MHGNMADEFSIVRGDQRSQRDGAGDEVLRRADPMGWPAVDRTDSIGQRNERRDVALAAGPDSHVVTFALLPAGGMGR